MHGEVILKKTSIEGSEKFVTKNGLAYYCVEGTNHEIDTNSATRAVNIAQGINTASTQSAADSSTTVKNLSDDMIIPSLLANQCLVCDDFGLCLEGTMQKDPANFALMAYSSTSSSSSTNSELDDFVDVNECVRKSVVEKPSVETNEPKTARKENRAPIIKDWVSESEEEDEPKFQTFKPNFTKIKFVKPKTDRKPVEKIRQDT
ncbi:hypothetical protein Tco_0808196 [Tanacetum coccineum]